MTLKTNNGLVSHSRSILMGGKNIEQVLEKEWLLTNSRGGFACGTVAGCNTRRYHGLLIGTLDPPANRIVGLSSCLETVAIGNETKALGCFEFEGGISPNGFMHLCEFSKDLGVHFDYNLWDVKIRKSIYLLPDSDVTAIVYEFSDMVAQFDFSVRPFIGLRDFHSLRKSGTVVFAKQCSDVLSVRSDDIDTGELLLRTENMRFERDEQWWYNFLYRKERQRGAECFEDLFSPGVFQCHIDSPGRVVLWASLGQFEREPQEECDELEIVIDSLHFREKELLQNSETKDPYLGSLYSAAGQFVVEREINETPAWTILAGFPWFLDWGRDTFISLEGLLLCTGRFDEARSVLKTLADAVDDGMIPNRFDDYGGQAHYNSIDASLWFVHAAFEYLGYTADTAMFSARLLPAVRWVIDSYRQGTRFGIHADEDGLITGGDEQTQLTWMDVKFDGLVFTPRYGKAVEINALWYSGLCRLAKFYAGKDHANDIASARFYSKMAEKVKESFVKSFWNESTGYLNDCILCDGTVDTSLRPNQIYAAALGFSPLTKEQKTSVVGVVQRELLTPYGLRTLSPGDSRYIGRYEGGGFERDSAYHQGTVWPYLLGAFIEAYLRANDFSRNSKTKAMNYLEPLLKHMTEDACIGSISEIFDGDLPQQPRGCFAQAWSVAEVLRAYKMITK